MCLRFLKTSVLKLLDRTVYTAFSSVGAYLMTLSITRLDTTLGRRVVLKNVLEGIWKEAVGSSLRNCPVWNSWGKPRRTSARLFFVPVDFEMYISQNVFWLTVLDILLLHQALNFLCWKFWPSQRRFSISLGLELRLSNF
jgi:hypothetical protein